MRGRALPLVALVLLVVPPACSGASDPDHLLGGGGSFVAPGAPDAGTDSPGQINPGKDSGTTSHPDSGTPVVDSSIPVVDTGIPIPEASPIETGPVTGSISCPPTTCSSPEVCCASGNGSGQTSFKCQSASKGCGSAAAPGTPISCSSTADCPKGVCCGANDNNGHYVAVACAATCQGQDANGDTLVQFCDPAAADCPTGLTCVASQLLPGLNVCGQ